MTNACPAPSGELPRAAYTALDSHRFHASSLTRGPWHPEHQHAGPPIALVAGVIEQAAAAQGLTHLARITANLLRPVPLGEVSVEVMTDYVGRNVPTSRSETIDVELPENREEWRVLLVGGKGE